MSLKPIAATCLICLLLSPWTRAGTVDATWDKPNASIIVRGGNGKEAGVWWFDADGLLRAAWNTPLAAEGPTALSLPSEGRWGALSGGTLRVFIHHDDAAAAELPVQAMPNGPAPGKPMAHGIARLDGQPPAWWYVDDDHTLVWSGKPWIPFGGMFVSPVLAYYDRRSEPIEDRWRLHAEALDRVQAAGFDELYINLAHGPVELRQQVVDDLNRRGIRFGWQFIGASRPMRGYLIRRNVAQGLIIGTCEQPGELQVQLPRENLFGLMLVGCDSDVVRLLDEPMNLADPAQRPDFIQIDTETQANAKVLSTKLRIDGLPTGRYYVLPNGAAGGHARDVWGNTAEILERHAWIRNIRWGAGLRFFVDPIANEEGIYNQAESVRAWTPAFNADYARWLERRYQTIDALATAWRLPAGAIEDFDEAARLVPLRDTDAAWAESSIRWIDPQSGRLITTVGGPGQGWLDYVEGVRDTYAVCRDEVARGVKAMVDVPVVYKRVTPWVSREHINRAPGGFDGVGLELYPGRGSMISQGLSAGWAEAELAAQTSWIVGTEMGYSPATNNGGITGFPSREYVADLLGTAAIYGARGFMLFGWRLEPYESWKPMQLFEQPEQLAWIAEARAAMLQAWPQPWPVAQAYPEGQCWWYKAGNQELARYTALLDDPVSLLRQPVCLVPPADGQRQSTQLWAISSSVPIPDARVRLVNFASRLSAERYGPQVSAWIAAGEPVIYLGAMPPGAAVAGLSDRFTEEQITIDGAAVQVLTAQPGDTVLAAEEGKPWAVRSGRLLIISRWLKPISANSDATPPGIDPAWVRDLVASPAGD